MNQCPKCGKTYDDSWKVCLHCNVVLGRDMSKVVPNAENQNNKVKKTFLSEL